MSFFAAIFSCLQKFAEYEGRATRKEYWSWLIAATLVSYLSGYAGAALSLHAGSMAGLERTSISMATGFVLFFPGLAVTVRRLHDVGKSGWWVLIILIPLLGALYLSHLQLKKGMIGPNLYGPDPNEATRKKRAALDLDAIERHQDGLKAFSREELDLLMEKKRAMTQARAATRVTRTSPPKPMGKTSGGFGRRGAGAASGFAGLQTSRQPARR
ncbi:DUF805 domain-containing protein [uncultured Cohaesibacter sp.]|uniref:DUF805 domain-containing protein n=1 Tax=uncultured Cohaesibacter sp. TaxID=1002546 RepID=UPI00292D44C4|nr:DUF805 domain-containing protein [uncultured Cohaesibacter sp.]